MNITFYPAPKRLNNELNSLNKIYWFNFEKIEKDYEITFFINTHVYTFNLLNTYPFTPPFIKVNGIDYYKLIHRCINLTNKYIYDDNNIDTCLKNRNCVCCSSFGCKSNWSPAIGLKDIIQEILENKKHFYNLYKIKYVRKILENKCIHEKGINNIIIDFIADI